MSVSEQERNALDEKCDELKQAYMARVRSFQAAEDAGELESAEEAFRHVHEAACRYFNHYERRAGYALARTSDDAWRMQVAEDCPAVLNSRVAYEAFLQNASARLGIDVKQFSPDILAYRRMQSLARYHFPDQIGELRATFMEVALPVSGFDAETENARRQSDTSSSGQHAMQNHERDMTKLLHDLFDADVSGLLQWIRLELGKEVYGELPSGASLSDLAFKTVLAIGRHGRADHKLFRSLCELRPHLAARIREVANLWGVTLDTAAPADPGTPPHSSALPLAETQSSGSPASLPVRRAVVLTALEVEFKAVRAHLQDCKEDMHPQGAIYERGRFVGRYAVWEVLVVQTGAGNAGAATEAERAVSYFEPEVALFVGVAGGLKDVELGDVVASTKVYSYEAGKAEETFKPRPNVHLSAYALKQRASAEARNAHWLARLPKPAVPVPNAFVGPIAAGEKVVASISASEYEFLRTQYSDALAVEMEGYGFLTAMHANQNIQALIVRGISDKIKGKSEADEGGSQERASDHAAAFAFEVLAKLGAPTGGSGPR